MHNQPFITSLVSVVIPCYNHGHFLTTAIDSVLAQTYKNIEIIVVDDGSSDNTKEVAQSYNDVRYIYKQNAGLSAARNTGIAESKGEYLLFLDADDWLYPVAIETNLQYLQQNKDTAFVSGGFDRVNLEEGSIEEKVRPVAANHYWLMLQGNYIGVPAAVLYRAWVFEKVSFDLSVPDSCSDYDLYLSITRNYPVLHHTTKVAAYRIHGSSMSSNSPKMLAAVLQVLKRQKNNLKNAEEEEAYKYGFTVWKNYYGNELYLKLRAKKVKPDKSIMLTLLKHKPKNFFKYLLLAGFPFLKRSA